ncbi:unnamed protein product [Zymoseptoria tritici ST99CH_1A5]|uniref:Reticulon-like protein n=1 Tax=Zymoseptoria tritici ST99CH_1A5 TaxID=1276529 RepID=A0A1Y6L6V9_ZYMTR|nr:unnamed protein product [Zymoseptoria tritici ST99CH_1A5]
MADTTTTPQNNSPAQQQQYPDLNPYSSSNGTSSTTSTTSPSTTEQTKQQANNILSNASQTVQQTMANIKNSETVQSVANGPLADKARVEADATKNEFSNLAASRQTPQTQTANGQELTHYHSFFYNLLSWENPRATAISYASIVFFVFAARYVPLTRYAMKALYTVLGITAAAELAGRAALGEGLSSKMRPRKYYTIPHETLESVLADAEELINFFVIEFQRVIFAENIYATIGAFLSAFLTYFLVKVMPKWGLFLFFTTVVYFAPLAYISNKEFIDEHLSNAQNIVSEQANQVRDIAAKQTNSALEASKSAISQYSAQAQEMIGQTKKAAVEKNIVSPQTAEKVTPAAATPEKAVNNTDFPSAPKDEPAILDSTHVEPIKSEAEFEPIKPETEFEPIKPEAESEPLLA